MKKLSLIITCLLFSAGASAQFLGGDSTQSTGSTVFSALDADRSGAIDQDEAKADPKLDEKFTEVDVNGDGQLSESEYVASVEMGMDSTTEEAE